MRVFVAGASGAVGMPLVRQLRDRGHEVTGTYTSLRKARQLHELGAVPVQLDLFDSASVTRAVLDAQPDAIVHQATALANATFGRGGLDKTFAQTNRLRSEGTDALLAAARASGVTRFVAQSFAPYRYIREGGWVKTEDDAIDPNPPQNARDTFAALGHLEDAVTAYGGIALRYGGFYGAENDGLIAPVRKRRFPVIGDGTGMMSFIHVDDAASATVRALELGKPGIFNIVDDDPAPMRDWLPVLATALGAKPPRHVPVWLARLIAGDMAVYMGMEARGASNAKAKRELGWAPRHATWREGFFFAYR